MIHPIDCKVSNREMDRCETWTKESNWSRPLQTRLEAIWSTEARWFSSRRGRHREKPSSLPEPSASREMPMAASLAYTGAERGGRRRRCPIVEIPTRHSSRTTIWGPSPSNFYANGDILAWSYFISLLKRSKTASNSKRQQLAQTIFFFLFYRLWLHWWNQFSTCVLLLALTS